MVDSSPRLFAASYVLLRLHKSRHPHSALVTCFRLNVRKYSVCTKYSRTLQLTVKNVCADFTVSTIACHIASLDETRYSDLTTLTFEYTRPSPAHAALFCRRTHKDFNVLLRVLARKDESWRTGFTQTSLFPNKLFSKKNPVTSRYTTPLNHARIQLLLSSTVRVSFYRF